MGAILQRDVVAPEFEVKSSSNSLQIKPRSGHDLAAIGPRLWLDRDLDPPMMPSEDRGSDSALKESRSRLDRSAIAVRSWCSSTSILHRQIKIQAIVIRTIAVLRAIRCRPHNGDRTHQKAPRVAQIANDCYRPMTIG